jgi:hypothetical protein
MRERRGKGARVSEGALRRLPLMPVGALWQTTAPPSPIATARSGRLIQRPVLTHWAQTGRIAVLLGKHSNPKKLPPLARSGSDFMGRSRTPEWEGDTWDQAVTLRFVSKTTLCATCPMPPQLGHSDDCRYRLNRKNMSYLAVGVAPRD